MIDLSDPLHFVIDFVIDLLFLLGVHHTSRGRVEEVNLNTL